MDEALVISEAYDALIEEKGEEEASAEMRQRVLQVLRSERAQLSERRTRARFSQAQPTPLPRAATGW